MGRVKQAAGLGGGARATPTAVGEGRGGAAHGGRATPPGRARERKGSPARMGKRRNPRCNNGGGSPEKMKFAGAEHKFTDWGRTVGRIDESKALG
jgi:hypothetical protein